MVQVHGTTDALQLIQVQYAELTPSTSFIEASAVSQSFRETRRLSPYAIDIRASPHSNSPRTIGCGEECHFSVILSARKAPVLTLHRAFMPTFLFSRSSPTTLGTRCTTTFSELPCVRLAPPFPGGSLRAGGKLSPCLYPRAPIDM
ncbi:hypothetical protein FA13DRAFT_381711 [Coprinellus micaceus]|uniref:Uncharacterized protein n=1 Tax=Coprinellus micaceus TaxID=71717 RepID=A0A4Y7SCR0_COPMI|nr:hypothetical protein FA13DRAFT_381711 [Coprinellus micaceus]